MSKQDEAKLSEEEAARVSGGLALDPLHLRKGTPSYEAEMPFVKISGSEHPAELVKTKVRAEGIYKPGIIFQTDTGDSPAPEKTSNHAKLGSKTPKN